MVNADPGPGIEPSPDAQLKALGLTVAALHRAAMVGLAARASRTSFAPRNAQGTDLYSHTTEALRLLLAGSNWVPQCVGGQERTVSPDGTTAIVVATGDGGVGLLATDAAWTAHPKGRLMRDAVADNQIWIQERFSFPGVVDRARVASPNPSTLVWVLLLKVEAAQLSMEMSLPDEVSDDGRVDSWARRIPLPPIELNGIEIDRHGDDGDDDGGIDVPVERR